MEQVEICTSDKRKVKMVNRLSAQSSGFCIMCNIRPIKIKKRKLCMSCYCRFRSGHSTPTFIRPSCEKRENQFISKFFTHNNWIKYPAAFQLNGTKYTPDFYDGRRRIFIEVVGTRQAFHYQKEKYELFREMYPFVPLEFRTSEGDLLNLDHNGRIHWDKTLYQNRGFMRLENLTFYDRFKEPSHNRGEYNHGAKLTTDQVIAIRNDPRSLSVISKEYGVHWQQIHKIKHKKTWKWLEPEYVADRRKPGNGGRTRKLSDGAVISIKEEAGTCEMLGNKYGCSATTVSKIKRNLIYSDITLAQEGSHGDRA